MIAQQLHAVQMVAYAQAAKLLGAIYFPPLERTVDEVQASDEVFVAAFLREELVAAASVWPDPEGLGMAAALLAAVLVTHGDGAITVQTGAKNLPALSLYARAGFTEPRRWWVGHEPLELVKLLQQSAVCCACCRWRLCGLTHSWLFATAKILQHGSAVNKRKS